MFEGVVTDPREADVGSILGFGFAPYTGGTLSFIDGMGPRPSSPAPGSWRRSTAPASRPPEKLVEMAEKGETFYGAAPASRRRRSAHCGGGGLSPPSRIGRLPSRVR